LTFGICGYKSPGCNGRFSITFGYVDLVGGLQLFFTQRQQFNVYRVVTFTKDGRSQFDGTRRNKYKA